MLYNKYRCLTCQNRMNNQYKVHPTFTGYAVSKDGDVINKKTNRKMKCRTNKDGYLIVGLMKDKKQYIKLINRLVLETYNPIENQHLYHAHHENRIRNDNNLKNLKWELKGEHIIHHHKGVKRSDEFRKRISEANKIAGKNLHHKKANSGGMMVSEVY